MGRREENKRKIEQRILEAGVRLLSGENGSSVTVQDIADAAGVSRATFFNYFDSKHDIAVAFGDRQCDIVESRARELDPALSTADKIREVMRADHAMVQERLQNHVFARYVMNTMLGSEPMARLEMRHWEELACVYERLLEEGKDRGDVPANVDAALGGRMIVDMYFSLQLESLFGDADVDFDAAVDRRLEVLFRGIGLSES